MRFKKILIVNKPTTDKTHKESLEVVKAVLDENKIKYEIANRNKLKNVKNYDLVITVGGDGTFLIASRYNCDVPMFGVNSNIQKTEGFYTRAHAGNFKDKFNQILQNNMRVIKLSRLSVTIGKKEISDHALNEVLVAHKKPHKVSRYTLKIESEEEDQKSSGVLIGTASGSYAWLLTAGGKTLPLKSKQFEYVVREPYSRSLAQLSMKKGVLSPKAKVTITPLIDDMILVNDSAETEYKLKKGQPVTIQRSSCQVKFVDV